MHPLLFYPLFAVVVPLLMLEGIFRLMPVSNPPELQPVTQTDPVAHYQPNVDYLYSSGPDFSIVSRKHSNNYGYNHRSDYRPEQTTPLLMVIGDSFVEGHTLDAGKTAAELLDAELAGSGRVYSIGISGAPLSQYLAFAQFAQTTFRPEAMAFVIISNDFDESLLKYKSEPRFFYFEESGKGAQLRRIDYRISEAKKVLRRSAFLRYVMLNLQAGPRLSELLGSFNGRARPAPYLGLRDADTPAEMEQRIADSKKAVDYFLDQLPALSGLASDAIVFVLDAVRPAIYSPETLRLAENSYHARMRRYFQAEATRRGYEVVDMQPRFIAQHRLDGSRVEYPTNSHWNELGNRLVAEEIEGSGLFRRTFRPRAAAPLAAQGRR